MSKRSFMTNITPLPSNISRETAIAQLHDYGAMIELNPLVLRYDLTHPPSNASRDEAESATWYEITDRINYLPGGIVKGEVSYKACFYSLPRGLQTHVFAPAGVDIRSKWSVCGNESHEPKEPLELGVKAPPEGLYIKEEVDLRCNVFMSSFVRRNLKKSHVVVADKIVGRATGVAMPAPVRKASHGSISDRSTSPLGAENTFSRDKSLFTTVSAGQAGPGHEQNASASRAPPRCACTGASHDSGCRFFHPDDINQSDPYPVVHQRQSKPYHAISIPSSASSYSQSPSRAFSPGPPQSAHSELYGSPAIDCCMCTGGLHEAPCRFYPGLRLPSFPALSLPETPTDLLQHSPALLIDFAPKEPLRIASLHYNDGSKPQRPGEQAELAAMRSPAMDDWHNATLVPEPLRSRGNSPRNSSSVVRTAESTPRLQ